MKLWKFGSDGKSSARSIQTGADVPAGYSTTVSNCSSSGCAAPAHWQCAYVDANHVRCQTRWCQSHGTVVDGWVFCRRHASVAETMGRAAGTLNEVKNVPAVGDRAVALAIQVGRDLNWDMLKLLEDCYGADRSVRIHADQTVRAVWHDHHFVEHGTGDVPLLTRSWRQRHWEWSWSVSNPAGYLKRITLSVPVAEEPEVTVKVDRTVVFAGVPDWIQRRQQGRAPLSTDQTAFKSRILAEVVRWVTPTWQAFPMTGSIAAPAPVPAPAAAPLPTEQPTESFGTKLRERLAAAQSRKTA